MPEPKYKAGDRVVVRIGEAEFTATIESSFFGWNEWCYDLTEPVVGVSGVWESEIVTKEDEQ